MNSLKKALASLFVLATIFVVFSCSNASDSNEKSDGNPFKGTKWESGGMTLEFIDSNTCVLDYGVSSYARVAMSSGTEYSYTWKENDDGSYTAILKIEDYDTGMTFTIDSSGAVSGTLYMSGQKITFSKKVDSEIEIDTDGDGAPFAGTKWVYVDEDGDEEELSFDQTTAIIFNSTYGFPYTSKQNAGGGYTATIGALNASWTFTIESADAEEGVLTGYGEDLTYKRVKK
ncbi:MAG: hypothetical protein K2N58_08450 [Treponemataceae bacterium]|nr:hypothetical protein [Treponemataceae bacterium]